MCSQFVVSEQQVILKEAKEAEVQLHWEEWLKYEGTSDLNKITLTSVPLNLRSVCLFPHAALLLNDRGLLILTGTASNIVGQFRSYLEQIASQFGFEVLPTSPGSDDLQFSFSKHEYLLPFRKFTFKSTYGYRIAVRQLFKKVFGNPISQEYWDWKYPQENSVNSLIALSDNRLVAHYGILNRGILIMGQKINARQVGDVMVDPSFRGGLVTGLFALLAAYTMMQMTPKNMLDKHGNSCMVGFGFPHGRQMKLAKRMSIYKDKGSLYEILIKGVVTATKGEVTEYHELSESFKSAWLSSWWKMKDNLKHACLVNRNWNYLVDRYWKHPVKSYRYFKVHNSFLIIQEEANNQLRLIDYIGEVEDLVVASRVLLDSLDKTAMLGWVIQWYMARLNKDENIEVVNNSASLAVFFHDNGDFSDYAKAPWWVAMGDTDFM